MPIVTPQTKLNVNSFKPNPSKAYPSPQSLNKIIWQVQLQSSSPFLRTNQALQLKTPFSNTKNIPSKNRTPAKSKKKTLQSNQTPLFRIQHNLLTIQRNKVTHTKALLERSPFPYHEVLSILTIASSPSLPSGNSQSKTPQAPKTPLPQPRETQLSIYLSNFFLIPPHKQRSYDIRLLLFKPGETL